MASNNWPTQKREVTTTSLESRLSELTRVQQAMWVYDFDFACITWANKNALVLWQAESTRTLSARDLSKDMTQTVALRLQQYRQDFSRDEDVRFKEYWTLYPNGEPQPVEVSFSPFRLQDDRMAMLCEAQGLQGLDNEALRSAQALLHTSVMITLYSAEGEPLYRNPAARASVPGSNENLSEHFIDQTSISKLEQTEEQEVNFVARVNANNGVRWHDISAHHCLDAVSGEYAWLISEVDVSQLKATQERANFLAEHDTLTGLPNRNYISKVLEQRIAQMCQRGEKGALIFIDLDHFKNINDSLGHDAGDKLLIEIANRLKSLNGNSQNIARLGGDEFLLLMGPVSAKSDIEHKIRTLKQQLSKPMTIHGSTVRVTPSIGVSLFPKDGEHINELMRCADLAMYHAKYLGRNEAAFFTQEMSEAVDNRINLESQLLAAIEHEQFTTFFQPRVNVRTGKVCGAEALVRWCHPQRGILKPAEFLPACEKSGLIGMVGKLVMKQAVIAQSQWKALGHPLRVSVNLSPRQFNEDTLVEDLITIVDANDGDPSLLELEFTESIFSVNKKQTKDKLQALDDYGFRIAIDDFGTGCSNLSCLHKYPIHSLKIDRSLVSQFNSSRPVIELIMNMARIFKLDVVAEGVETQEQLDALTGYDCPECQGFLFAPALSRDEFASQYC